ncbi:apoptosis-related Tfar19 related protein [Thermoplasma acidophilum]|nr:apoptosis-related Tfar19 related protein [Thermoplasma acidophilum]
MASHPKVMHMDDDEELERIRRQQLESMQRQAMQEQMREEQEKQREAERARRQQILRQILDPSARERLNNVRLVRPDLADNVENQLIQLASMGRINRMLSERDIIDILSKLTENKREPKIERRSK